MARFVTFFHHIDHHKTEYFLWVTAEGIDAAKHPGAGVKNEDISEDEADPNGQEG
jgi:tRNA pseudouridine38-40 synthase